MPLAGRRVLVALAVSLLGGCTPWLQAPRGAKQQALLRPATPSESSVTLEILFVRFPHGQAEINGPLWDQVDEQHLPNELRRQLDANGFRAGLVGAQIPSELARLLKQTDKMPEDTDKLQSADLEEEPVLRRRVLQLRQGRRGEILASGIYEKLPLLLRKEGQVGGRTYSQAQALFGIQAALRDDRRVAVTLTPELHHGEAKQHWNGRDGVFRMEMSRPREIFDHLRLDAALAPGQMLVLSSLPERTGSLGHHFFSDRSARGPEQKLLLIRLVQVPPAELFAADDMP